jgi:hypothetical protein
MRKKGVFGLAPETLVYMIAFGILALIIIAIMRSIFKR